MDLHMRLIDSHPGGRFLLAPPQVARMEPTDPLVQKNDFCSTELIIFKNYTIQYQYLYGAKRLENLNSIDG
jgi:hypothetical protein